jgi:hypothetical protein
VTGPGRAIMLSENLPTISSVDASALPLDGKSMVGHEHTCTLTPSMAPLNPPSLPFLKLAMIIHSVQALSGSASLALMKTSVVGFKNGETAKWVCKA